jgi:hypothetical protein
VGDFQVAIRVKVSDWMETDDLYVVGHGISVPLDGTVKTKKMLEELTAN